MFTDQENLSIGAAAGYLSVSTDTLRRWDKSGKLPAKRGSGKQRYYSKLDLELYKQDIFALATDWVLNTAKEPNKDFYCPTSTEFKGHLSKLQNSLKKTKGEQHSLIVAIAGEIGNNSYDHNLGNWLDIMGIFFAFDTSKNKIVLADRGIGVFRTLKRVKPEIKNDEEALHTAFTEILSGRAPESRGNGLKFVREVVINNKLELEFYSGCANVTINGKEKSIKFTKTDTYYSGCLALIKY